MTTRERMLELSDGRTLAIAEAGDPDGTPVLFSHGTPGSRRQMPTDPTLTDRLGVRLITVDRPGYGGSSRQRGRVVHSWSRDLDELTELLGVGRFGVAGWSGGAAFALAAAEVHADRVLGVGLVAPFGPFDDEDAPDYLPTDRARQVRILRSRHVGTRAVARLSGLALRRTARQRAADPEGTADALAAEAPEADRRVLRRRDVRAQLVDDITLSLRQGAAGWADDLGALLKPWAVDFRAVRAPVTVWHGKDDHEIAPAAAHLLVGAIPHAVLHLVDGGHHVVHDLWAPVIGAACGRQ